METNYSFFTKQQVGETVRELGLAGQNEKGTPTMGGLIIIFATLVPVLLLQNCTTFILYSLYHALMGTIVL
jgi:UDP-N-acetylmuramyl pentapeptide phosphotransferase/UDP-N-acetylglucosamine-1-phosphate transferase